MAITAWMLRHINDDEDDSSTSLSIEEQSDRFQIAANWLLFLKLTETDINYLDNVYKMLESERSNATVYPELIDMHRWSRLCSPEVVKIVIVGQDPYHDGRGTGVAFGTRRNCSAPDSLKNIFKELARSTNFIIPKSGCIDGWCKQGVLLLNTVFTVIHGQPMSHQNLGWQRLSHKIITTLSKEKENLVFCLWGMSARSLSGLIDRTKHLVLESSHPSPRVTSTKIPFIGNNHFVQANEFLLAKGLEPINWHNVDDNVQK